MSVSILSYFFTLSVFSWMSVEGIHILLMLIFVFQDTNTNYKKYTAVAYGTSIARLGQSLRTTTPNNFYHPNQLSI